MVDADAFKAFDAGRRARSVSMLAALVASAALADYGWEAE
jgi:hypothetical protein